MRKGKQTSLPDALDSLSRKLDRKGGGRYLQLRVGQAWESVAGTTVMGHTTRAHLRDGELVIYVDSPVWATELSALAGPYQEALNEKLGEKAVRAMRFAVSRKVEQDHLLRHRELEIDKNHAQDDISPIPLTAVERAQVEASTADIPGDDLREAVLKATITGMEWEKGRKAAQKAQRPRESL